MVASDKEGEEIVEILLHYMPTRMALTMMQEVWNDVGTTTENESLRDTILLFQDYILKSIRAGN